MANEMRLIDAWALVSALAKKYHKTNSTDTGMFCYDALMATIADAPTVDAVEVVHGRWECEYDEQTGETDVTCSNCKDTRTINGCYVSTQGEPLYTEDAYCPNCGAKMDGGNEDV